MSLTQSNIDTYRAQGYILLRSAVDPQILDDIESSFASIVAPYYPIKSRGLHSADFAGWLSIQTAGLQARLYDQMRAHTILRAACNAPCIKDTVRGLLNSEVRVTDHSRFRMDQPHDTRFMAVWHQDAQYTNIPPSAVTVWFPLQDTPWQMGPILVMRSLFNALPLHGCGFKHDITVNRRKSMEIGEIEAFDLRMLAMKRGDLLLFHALLPHSGQVNLSDRVRFSVQGRYEPL